MALCGTIKHHNKNEKPCVLGFWHFLTSERIAGISASLSAQSPVNRKIYRTFYFYVLVVLLLGESKTFVAHIILLCF